MMNNSALQLAVKQMTSVLLQLPDTMCDGEFPDIQQKENELRPTTDYKTLLNYFKE